MAVVAGPNSPKSADDRDSRDKSRRPGLDAPPPLPPGGTVNMSVLAGQPGSAPQGQGGTPPTGDMAGMVVQRAALLDQQIQQLAQMLPQFVPMAAQMSQLLKQGIVQSLQMAQQGGGGPAGGAAPPMAPQPGMVPPPGAGGAGGAPAPMPMAGLAG